MKDEIGTSEPEEQHEQIGQMLETHWDLLKKVGEEIEQRKGQGEDHMQATLGVMKKYEKELAEL